jgi:hypothetical protein
MEVSMILRLNDEQRQALAESSPPVEVADEQAQRTYYLISEEQYKRMKPLLEAEIEEIDPSLYEFTDIEMFGENE